MKPNQVIDLLMDLRKRGVELRAEGAQLRVNAPKGAVTSEVAASIANNKKDILDFLLNAAALENDRRPIPRVDPGLPIPLSFGQQRLWYLSQLTPQSPEYNVPMAMEIAGEVDESSLCRAFGSIVARHEALRTSFSLDAEGRPRQVVAPISDFEVTTHDLTPLGEKEADAKCRSLLADWSSQALDLSHGLLFRVELIRLRRDARVLFFMPHHTIYDGWSHKVFLFELQQYYAHFSAGVTLELAELPINYADFAAWQRQLQGSNGWQAGIEYWTSVLGGELPVLELPTKAPRAAERASTGSTVEFVLENRLTEALFELGRREAATPFMSLLAGFAALIGRYARQQDLIIGTPVANRPHEDVAPLIGFFANTIALRLDLSTEQLTFAGLLAQTRESCLGAYAHQDLPFDQVVRVLNVPRERGRTPVYQCMFSFDEMGVAPVASSDAQSLNIVGHRHSGTGASSTDLAMWLRRDASGIVGTLEYSTELFDRSFIQQIVRSYVALLECAVAQPQTRLGDLTLLEKDEVERLAREPNNTKIDYPGERQLHQWFEQMAVTKADQPAVSCGGITLTFAELDARANQFANHLQRIGIGPDRIVGVCVHRSLDMLAALFGVLKAGGAYLPLDPKYPRARLAYMLEDSGATALIAESGTIDIFEGVQVAAVVLVDAHRAQIDSESVRAPKAGSCGSHLAYAIYTSGSTGKSKGVLIEHRNTANFFVGMRDVLQRPGIWLNDTSISFDISVLEIFGALGHGFHVIVRREIPDESESVPSLIRQHAVTHFQCTPSQALMLAADSAGRSALGTLDYLLVGGEELTCSLATQLLSSMRGALVNVYGPTETTVWSTLQVISELSDPMPIGRPIANTEVYVLDSNLKIVPRGAVGELWIGGAGVARGYHQRSELTADRFRPNPFGAEGRIYRTGDEVRFRADGLLEYRGRTDFQVKLRGHRIELGEIEAALRQCSGIREVVVALRQDIVGDARLVAYVALAPNGVFDPDSYDARLRQQLSEIMLPSAYVELATFPLTPNGKVDRKALPAPEHKKASATAVYEPPTTTVERALAQVWSTLLGVERVGRQDDFFALGGHSLLAVQMVRKLKTDYGIELPLGSIFAAPKLQSLATRTSDSPVDEAFIMPLRSDGSNATLYCVCGLHLYAPLADALKAGQPVCGVFVPGDAAALRDLTSNPDAIVNVEGLAAEYIAAIKVRQPSGPYCFAGVSFGGVLAYEMAQQLTRSGEEVRLVALFDSLLPRSFHRSMARYAAFRLKQIATRGPSVLRNRLSLGLGHLFGDRDRAAPPPVGLEEARNDLYVRSMTEYDKCIQPYGGDIVVFRAADHTEIVGYEIDESCGWRSLATGKLHVHEIGGNHLGILEDPMVDQLASVLRVYLDRVSAGLDIGVDESVIAKRFAE